MNIIEIPKTLLAGEPTDLKITADCWIAGGAIRNWYLGKPNKSDIDFFFAHEAAFELFKSENSMSGVRPIQSSKNAETFKVNGKLIQLIRVADYANVEALLDSFDFTVCQFAYDGEKVYSTVEAITCVHRGHLMVNKIQAGYELDSLRRAFKYAKKGFEPCWGCLKEIADSFRDLSADALQQQLEISPSGGKRVKRFD